MAGQHLANVSIDEIFSNPAYMGIFRKYMTRTAEEEPEQRDSFAMSLAMFEFFMDVQDFKSEPDAKVLPEMAKKIFVNFVEEKGTMALSCFSAADREALATKLSNLLSSPVAEARKTFDAAQEAAVGAIEKQCFSGTPPRHSAPFGAQFGAIRRAIL